MTGVSISTAHKNYGAVEVLHGISAEIEPGEFAVLVGPSGCGKSTLLRMIAGLEVITAGTIKIGDKVVNELPPKDRDIAMVFQSYALYPHMSVADNMAFSMLLRREDKKKIADRVRMAAESLGLTEYLDRYPRELSGGQRQRVAMGRAIVRDPQVYLFDEPLSNLDAKLRVAMRSELRELQQRLNTTTIYVTHDQVEAMTMADKIIVMNAGVIEQIGKPLEVYDKPANVFVAAFIGSPAMNLLSGTVSGSKDKLTFTTRAGDTLPLPPGGSGLEAGREMICGIRPEHIRIGSQGLPVEAVLTEPTGAETLITTRYDGANFSLVSRERVQAERGEKLHLDIDPADIHLFDAETGQRVGD